MNVLVIGSKGMAGHMVSKYLKSVGHTVYELDRSILDLEDIPMVVKFFDALAAPIDYVINCVGVLVNQSIANESLAFMINAWFPNFLVKTYENTSTRVIHLSTDCVFDGSKGNYTEADPHTEMNAYGRSKSWGEIHSLKDVTLRMSIIGPELKANGTGLMNWVLNSKETHLPGWTNAWWNGITTLQLAKCIDQYMQTPVISGVYHLVSNENRINKYELLCKINEVYELGKTIDPIEGPKNIDKTLVDTRKIINFGIPDYDTMLRELKAFSS